MGCSADTGIQTLEEEDLVCGEERSLLHRVPARELDSIVCKFSTGETISESQLAAVVHAITEKSPSERRAVHSVVTGLWRQALRTFLILVGSGGVREKAELLFEVGTNNFSTPQLSRAQAEVLATNIFSAAADTSLRFSSQSGAKNYGVQLQRVKSLALPQLLGKMLASASEVSSHDFVRSYSDIRLCSLAGVRKFIVSCSEKQKRESKS